MIIKDFELKYADELVCVWNQSLVKDKIANETFEKKVINDSNRDDKLILLAMVDETVAGFIIGIKRKVPYFERGLEETKAWISAMGVFPQYSKSGIATALLLELEKRFYELNVQEIILGSYSPNYFMPGIDIDAYPIAKRFFEKHGYKIGSMGQSMCRLLFGYEKPDFVVEKQNKAENKGFKFLRYNSDYKDKMLSFTKANFSSGWHYQITLLMDANIAESHMWICVDKDNEIVGYLQRGMDSQEARIGPFGVQESSRNHSIGSILLSNMLLDMSKRGIYLAYFMTTDVNGARFYSRHGFEKVRCFYHYNKQLGEKCE